MFRHAPSAHGRAMTPTSRRIPRAITYGLSMLAAIGGIWVAPFSSSLPIVESLPVPGGDATALAACPNMQTLVNNASAGSTVTVPACTYHQAVKISKAITVKADGAVIDGDNRRSSGLVIDASDVTVEGITVKRVKTSGHDGAIYVNGVSRFTLKNATVRDSTPICLSLNGGSGHQILDSRLTNCAREGFFANGVTDSLFARNTIDRNNASLLYDWSGEAGGGKAMASRRITFDANTVAYNQGPGIWFDNSVVDATATNNRIHHNGRAGINFEISNGAVFSDNAIWENGWGRRNWAFGAGITISSSANAEIHHNTIAWNNRGISVISQLRPSPPHKNNFVHDNVVMSSTGDLVAGWYEDYSGGLFLAANNNRGSLNRYWVGKPEGGCRFGWKGCRSTLSAYNATRGEEGGTYVSSAQRDSLLAAVGIPHDDGTPPIGAPPPKTPHLAFGSGVLGTSTVPGRAVWGAMRGVRRYGLQVRRDSGSWQTLRLSSSRALSRSLTLAAGHWYTLRLRVVYGGGMLSRWAYSPKSRVNRLQETTGSLSYAGSWHRIKSLGASGGYVAYTTSTGATAKFAFDGRSFMWVSPKGPTRGAARVYVDGTYRATINLHATSFGARRIVFRASWSTKGHHEVVIRGSGTSGHPRIDVDAVGYIG
jgi:nitrous oxidase accessory protein NosD